MFTRYALGLQMYRLSSGGLNNQLNAVFAVKHCWPCDTTRQRSQIPIEVSRNVRGVDVTPCPADSCSLLRPVCRRTTLTIGVAMSFKPFYR